MIKCPKCNSIYITSDVWTAASVNVDVNHGIIIGVYDPIEYDPYDVFDLHCEECEHEWERY